MIKKTICYLILSLAWSAFGCSFAQEKQQTDLVNEMAPDIDPKAYFEKIKQTFTDLVEKRKRQLTHIDRGADTNTYELDYEIALVFQDAEYFCLDFPGEDCSRFTYWFENDIISIDSIGSKPLKDWNNDFITWYSFPHNNPKRRWGIPPSIRQEYLESENAHIITSSGNYIEIDFSINRVLKKRSLSAKSQTLLFDQFMGANLYKSERTLLASQKLQEGNIRFYDYHYETENLSITELTCETYETVYERKDLVLCDQNGKIDLVDLRKPKETLYSFLPGERLTTLTGSSFKVHRPDSKQANILADIVLGNQNPDHYTTAKAELTVEAEPSQGVFLTDHQFWGNFLLQTNVCGEAGCKSTLYAWDPKSQQVSKSLELRDRKGIRFCLNLDTLQTESCKAADGGDYIGLTCQTEPNGKGFIACQNAEKSETHFFASGDYSPERYFKVKGSVPIERINYDVIHQSVSFKAVADVEYTNLIDLKNNKWTRYQGEITHISRFSREHWIWSPQSSGFLLHLPEKAAITHFSAFVGETDHLEAGHVLGPSKSTLRPHFAWTETGVILSSLSGRYWIDTSGETHE